MIENFETLFKWSQTDFLSPKKIDDLRNFFGNLEIAWEKGDEKSFKKAGINPNSVDGFFQRKTKLNIEKLWQKYQKIGAKMMFIEDENYPQQLKEIDAPPIFLFYKGEIKEQDNFAFAVVGSRVYSAYGKEATLKIVPDIAKAGFTIVSGLARGIDTLAHKEALRMEGRTLAILGSGIDNIWPSENRSLAEKIIDGQGAVISEFPLGTAPIGYNFPRRNRIISGLSKGVLVIEGKKKSGSLITAHIALNQGREVFSLPGNGFSALSEGPNTLIKKGEAKLVTCVEDILEEFNLDLKTEKKDLRVPKNEKEKSLLDILGDNPKMFDEIVAESELGSAEISSLLTILEIKGYAQNLGMGQWVRI